MKFIASNTKYPNYTSSKRLLSDKQFSTHNLSHIRKVSISNHSADLLSQLIIALVTRHLSVNEQQLHAYLRLIYLEGLLTTVCNL